MKFLVVTNCNGFFINPEYNFIGTKEDALAIAAQRGFSGLEIIYDVNCWRLIGTIDGTRRH